MNDKYCPITDDNDIGSLIMSNDNMDMEWKCLIMINLDIGNHSTDDDESESQHHEDALKRIKLMPDARISDWLIMDNDNMDMEWKCLNRINLDIDNHGTNDDNIDYDNMDMELKRLNRINLDRDIHCTDNDNVWSQHHRDALKNIGLMCESHISEWLIMDKDKCNINIDGKHLILNIHDIDNHDLMPDATMAPNPCYHPMIENQIRAPPLYQTKFKQYSYS